MHAPLLALPTRREMTAALADASNSLNPGRRSSITTLMPTSLVYASALAQDGPVEYALGGDAPSTSRSAVTASERILASVLNGNGEASGSGIPAEAASKPIYKRSHTASHPVQRLGRSAADTPAIDLSDDVDDSIAESPASTSRPSAAFDSRSRPRATADGSADGYTNRSAAPPTARPSRRPQTSHNAGIRGDRADVHRFGSSSVSRAVRPSPTGSDAASAAAPAVAAQESSDRRSNGASATRAKRPGTSDGGPSATTRARPRATASGRPGWEGDEVVSVLREDGVQGEPAIGIL